jgi:hypothetical protein
VTGNSKNTAFDALRSLRRTGKPGQKEERCALCGAGLNATHAHLLDRAKGNILCSCGACAVLFSHREDGRTMLRIPTDARRLDDFRMTDAEWSALMLPIDLAFFMKRSGGQTAVSAYYPSPAGNMESLLALEAWDGLLRENPVLADMQPDVEALLVNRTQGRRDVFIAPIDQCYRLTGLIRLHWRGLSGGEDVWREIDAFFDQLTGGVKRGVRAHA